TTIGLSMSKMAEGEWWADTKAVATSVRNRPTEPTADLTGFVMAALRGECAFPREFYAVISSERSGNPMDTTSGAVQYSRSAHPADDPGDAVDRHLRPVRNAAGRIGHAEHHRDAAFARQRREVGSAAAAFGHDPPHARQEMIERR